MTSRHYGSVTGRLISDTRKISTAPNQEKTTEKRSVATTMKKQGGRHAFCMNGFRSSHGFKIVKITLLHHYKSNLSMVKHLSDNWSNICQPIGWYMPYNCLTYVWLIRWWQKVNLAFVVLHVQPANNEVWQKPQNSTRVMVSYILWPFLLSVDTAVASLHGSKDLLFTH